LLKCNSVTAQYRPPTSLLSYWCITCLFRISIKVPKREGKRWERERERRRKKERRELDRDGKRGEVVRKKRGEGEEGRDR
jgi:hypothetical protein